MANETKPRLMKRIMAAIAIAVGIAGGSALLRPPQPAETRPAAIAAGAEINTIQKLADDYKDMEENIKSLAEMWPDVIFDKGRRCNATDP